jgi:hypothetical protein
LPSEVLYVKKNKLDEILEHFPAIKSYMEALANEKVKYAWILQDSLVKRYLDPKQKDTLIAKRMENEEITLYMSLKRQMKRKKDIEVNAR